MSQDFLRSQATRHELTAFPARDTLCTNGVQSGHGLDVTEPLCPGDVYKLPEIGASLRLDIDGPDPRRAESAGYTLRPGNGPGRAAVPVTPGPLLRMMCPHGRSYDLRCVWVGSELMIIPSSIVDLNAKLTLLSVSEDSTPLPVADPTTLGFARGTRISRADGSLCPIEDLRPGDTVMTRDGRAQPILGVLSETFPAIGQCARVVIRAGTLGNDAELVVNATQRLLVPGHRKAGGTGAPDPLPMAGDIVNGLTITCEPGGSIEYFQIVLETHDIIYAEGVAAESMLLSHGRRAGLSDDLALQVLTCAPGLYHTPHPLTVPATSKSPEIHRA